MLKVFGTLLSIVTLLSAIESSACQIVQTYGIREQAPGNCYIMGGTPLSCSVINWRTQYQVCQCQVNCSAQQNNVFDSSLELSNINSSVQTEQN